MADAYWRDPMIGQWEEYYSASKDDEPIHFVVDLLNIMSIVGNFEVVAVTGRPEKWRALTMNWLIAHQVPVERLYMRPDYDRRSSNVLKVDIVRAKLDLNEVAFALEDRERDAAAYREIGINVLIVTKGGFRDGQGEGQGQTGLA